MSLYTGPRVKQSTTTIIGIQYKIIMTSGYYNNLQLVERNYCSEHIILLKVCTLYCYIEMYEYSRTGPAKY